MTMTAQDALDTVQKMMSRKSVAFADGVRAGWNKVCDKLEAHYLASHPRLTPVEIHGTNETARAAYLIAVAQDKPIGEAVAAAIKIVDEP